MKFLHVLIFALIAFMMVSATLTAADEEVVEKANCVTACVNGSFD